MSNLLKIGDRLLDSDQVISALVQYKLLDPLIGQVIVDEAIQSVALSEQELFSILTGTRDAVVPDSLGDFLAQWCTAQGVTLEYFHAVMLRDLKIQKFKQLQFAHQIESEFMRLKPELDQVEYSLIQLDSFALAQEIYFQLRDDQAEFAAIANHYNQLSQHPTNGWIGPVSLSTLPVEIATLFRTAQVGTIYEPQRIADEFWVVRLEQFIAARLTEATRLHLLNRLFSEWLRIQTRNIMNTPGAIALHS
jgi:parvulin-like peptidyl-prolyl isomerase